MVDTAAAADLSQTFNEEDPVDPLAATPAEIPGISAAAVSPPPPAKTKPSKRELREIGSPPPPPPDPLSAGGFIASPTYYADMLKAGQQQMAEVEFVCLSI